MFLNRSCLEAHCYYIPENKRLDTPNDGLEKVAPFEYVLGSKLPLFLYNRGWSSTQ